MASKISVAKNTSIDLPARIAGAEFQAGRMRVRAVTLGMYRCLAFQTDLATTRRGSGSSPVGIHYGSARSASSCRNRLFWICRECAETCT